MLYSASTCVAEQPLICARASASPRIDGDLGDACWQQAAAATDFCVLGSGGEQRAARQTTARAAWDDGALYWHIICLEPDPQSITAEVRERDGAVWLEDAVELFLQPQPPKGPWYHVIVNACGTWYDALEQDASWNANLTVQVRRGRRAWTVELALPWDAVGGRPRPGAVWGCNVAREHRPKEPKEWSTWAALARNKHVFGLPELFGRLEFHDGPGKGGRVTHWRTPDSLVTDPAFAERDEAGRLRRWRTQKHTQVSEIVPGSAQFLVENNGDYAVVSQALDVPVKRGDVFTVWALIEGSTETAAGIALVQEMEDGRPDDLYPFWNMPVSDKLALYRGKVVVDEGAKRLKSLVLYRANRKGRIGYAYVQVRPGLHGDTGLVDTRKFLRREERGIGEPWVTPHLRSFRPLAGGKLRALVFIGEFQRDAVELAQRLDLDYDLVYCPSFRGSGKVECCFSEDPQRVIGGLVRGEYEVILLAGRPSSQAVVDAIVQAVEAGCGLVRVGPVKAGRPADDGRWKQLASLLPKALAVRDVHHEILAALPLNRLQTGDGSSVVVRALGSGEHGKGRVVNLVWSRTAQGIVPDAKWDCEYWEQLYAVVARAMLWAARRERTVRITKVEVGERVRVILEASEPLIVTVELTWDHRERDLCPPREARSVKLRRGRNTVELPVPPEVGALRGLWLARCSVRGKDNRALDFAAGACDGPEGSRIVKLDAPQEVAPGEQFRAQVTASGPAGERRLRASVVDAWGREVARTEKTVTFAAPEQTAELLLTLEHPLSVYHQTVVTLLQGGLAQDRARATLLCPAATRRALDDFHLAAGYAAMSIQAPAHLKAWAVRFLREQGVTAMTVDPAAAKEGLPGWGGTAGGMGMRYNGASTVRQPCFSDRRNVQALAEKTVAVIAAKRPWGWLGYNMNDEVHLHQSGKVEVCTCDFCRRGFQDWAREQYPNIEAANRSWGTSYGDFDAIEVPLLKDLKGYENPARWVDFRLFQERVWANAFAATHRAVRAKYPDVRLSFTNPYHYDSLSGVDFSLWLPHEEILLRYFKPHVVDQCRSWSSAPMVSWFGYRLDAAQAGVFPWWFAFNGGVMPIWWDPLDPWAYSTKESFTPWYMCDPLWRPTGRSEQVSRAARELQGGIGALLRAAPRDSGPVAILHSQASMHVTYAQAAFPLGRPTEAGWKQWLQSRNTMAELLHARGFGYETLNAPDVTPEVVKRFQVILLPSAPALSDRLISDLSAFVESGGKLLADVPAGTHTEHGAPVERPAWRALFDGKRAVCLGERASADNAVKLGDALDGFEVKGGVRWETADGQPVTAGELHSFGGGCFIGAVRHAAEQAQGQPPVRIMLPERRHVYDVRRGKYLGERTVIEAPLPPGSAVFFAALSDRPRRLSLQAESGALGESVSLSARLESPGAEIGVIHVEVKDCDGKPLPWYSRNVRVRHGIARWELPLALNDPPGRWRIEARDVASGLRATTTVQVRE